jgi:hypothetical protein
MEAVQLLRRAWEVAGKPCGKLLKPVLGIYLESLRRDKGVDEAAATAVLGPR